MMAESAGLIFLRRLERRAQKNKGSIEVGTGDLNLIIRDYAQVEAKLSSAILICDDLMKVIHIEIDDPELGSARIIGKSAKGIRKMKQSE